MSQSKQWIATTDQWICCRLVEWKFGSYLSQIIHPFTVSVRPWQPCDALSYLPASKISLTTEPAKAIQPHPPSGAAGICDTIIQHKCSVRGKLRNSYPAFCSLGYSAGQVEDSRLVENDENYFKTVLFSLVYILIHSPCTESIKMTTCACSIFPYQHWLFTNANDVCS